MTLNSETITPEHRDFYGLSKRWCIEFFIFSIFSDASENPMDNFVTHCV
jgi:hypothetical protein